MKRIVYAIAVTAMCSSVGAVAQDKPTPAEAKKVINYYFNGKGQGAIPMDYKICKEIAEQGDMKNECIAEVTDKKVAKGEEAYLWMNFLVPAGEESKILVQYSRNNMVRNTSNITLGGATRFRTWKKIPTATAGDWQIIMIQEMDDGDMDIGKMSFSVVDASQ